MSTASSASPLSSPSNLASVPRTPLALAGIALALGLAVEILFYGHRIGISFPIWAALGIATILAATRIEGVRPAPSTLALIPVILFFAVVPAIRLEPLTVVLSMLATVLLFALVVRALLHGRLHRFGFVDFVLTLITVPLEAVLRPWPSLGVVSRQVAGDRVARSRSVSVLRGVLIAIPVLVVFIGLLTTADLVFGDLVKDALAWIDLERVAEYIGRGLVVLVSGIFFLGALISALRAREPRKLIGEQEPILKPFIGFIETVIVLGSVVLVFGFFGTIQIQYLFGGEANITATGYTYSEYARRGFGELVWAAFLSLGLIFALGHWGRRADKRQRWIFIGLSTALVVMLGVALASALMRLQLYENAFGFTRLRTYTHVFIFWLALLLVVFLVLLYLQRLRAFAPIAAAAGLGFVATLSAVNVDGFVAAQNLARFEETDDLDVAYLAQLTPDAYPVISERLGSVDGLAPSELRAQLACKAGILNAELPGRSWQSFHVGRQRASDALASLSADLNGHQVWMEDAAWYVADPDGEEFPCLGMWQD
jgi:hypothetical protein